MESIWNISLMLLWAVVLVNLLLTLRVVRWQRARVNEQKQAEARETFPELAVDAPAPEFRARTLTGQQVQLATYTGQSVLFIFVSPRCDSCRLKLPLLTKLRPLAKERSGVEFVLVSDSSAAETYAWVESIREEEKVEVDFPILVDPQLLNLLDSSTELQSHTNCNATPISLPCICRHFARISTHAKSSRFRFEWSPSFACRAVAMRERIAKSQTNQQRPRIKKNASLLIC